MDACSNTLSLRYLVAINTHSIFSNGACSIPAFSSGNVPHSTLKIIIYLKEFNYEFTFKEI